MIIDGRFVAPQIGTWTPSHLGLPEEGVVVLGLAWNQSGVAAVCLMEWTTVEEDEDVDMEDYIFTVRDRTTGEEKRGVWLEAFPSVESDEDEDDSDEDEAGCRWSIDGERVVPPPMMWAETKWVIPAPFKICEDCDGIKATGGFGQCCDGEACE